MDALEAMGDPSPQDEDDEETSMLKAAVHHTVYKISQDCEKHLDVRMDRKAVAAIADLTFRTMGRFGRDLELFAKHAKHAKIGPDDVRLLFRNNPTICEHLDTMVSKLEKHKIQKARVNLKKRERKAKEKDKGEHSKDKFDKLSKNPRPTKVARTEEVEEENIVFLNDFDF